MNTYTIKLFVLGGIDADQVIAFAKVMGYEPYSKVYTLDGAISFLQRTSWNYVVEEDK